MSIVKHSTIDSSCHAGSGCKLEMLPYSEKLIDEVLLTAGRMFILAFIINLTLWKN